MSATDEEGEYGVIELNADELRDEVAELRARNRELSTEIRDMRTVLEQWVTRWNEKLAVVRHKRQFEETRVNWAQYQKYKYHQFIYYH